MKQDTMARGMTKDEVRNLTKNNIRRDFLQEDKNCDFCGELYRPIQRNQRFCSSKDKCSNAFHLRKYQAKERGISVENFETLIKIEKFLIMNPKSKRVIIDLMAGTVKDSTPV